MDFHYSNHAFLRVKDRLSLSPRELVELLRFDLVIPLGVEPHTTKVHKLFYSYPDDCCFVAVQDSEDGTIVTILPIDYHHRWEISMESQNKARELILGKETSSFTPESSPYVFPDFKIGIYVQGEKQHLGIWPGTAYKGEFSNLLKDFEFVSFALSSIKDELGKVTVGDCISIQKGKKGKTRCYFVIEKDGHFDFQEE
jgi:hypothetical protein